MLNEAVTSPETDVIAWFPLAVAYETIDSVIDPLAALDLNVLVIELNAEVVLVRPSVFIETLIKNARLAEEVKRLRSRLVEVSTELSKSIDTSNASA